MVGDCSCHGAPRFFTRPSAQIQGYDVNVNPRYQLLELVDKPLITAVLGSMIKQL